MNHSDIMKLWNIANLHVTFRIGRFLWEFFKGKHQSTLLNSVLLTLESSKTCQSIIANQLFTTKSIFLFIEHAIIQYLEHVMTSCSFILSLYEISSYWRRICKASRTSRIYFFYTISHSYVHIGPFLRSYMTIVLRPSS